MNLSLTVNNLDSLGDTSVGENLNKGGTVHIPINSSRSESTGLTSKSWIIPLYASVFYSRQYQLEYRWIFFITDVFWFHLSLLFNDSRFSRQSCGSLAHWQVTVSAPLFIAMEFLSLSSWFVLFLKILRLLTLTSLSSSQKKVESRISLTACKLMRLDSDQGLVLATYIAGHLWFWNLSLTGHYAPSFLLWSATQAGGY